MPAIDYRAIREKIIEILRADPDLGGIDFEASLVNDMDITAPTGNVVLLRRTAPPGQPIAAGTRTRYLIDAVVYVTCGAIERMSAENQRDTFTSRIEYLLQSNRTIGGLVSSSWLTGGELVSGTEEKSGYSIAGSEVNFILDVTLTA